MLAKVFNLAHTGLLLLCLEVAKSRRSRQITSYLPGQSRQITSSFLKSHFSEAHLENLKKETKLLITTKYGGKT